MKAPNSRDTKPCPHCDEQAVFRDRIVRPGGDGNRLTHAQHHQSASEFVAAWKCENPACDYFEEFHG